MRMTRITPCLWFADQAEEAAQFYTSVFPNSRIAAITRYGRPASRSTGVLPAAS